MRKYIPYGIAAALCVCIILKVRTPSQPNLPVKGNTVYDTTLAMLKYFVAKDNRLGFANVAETDSAWIDMGDSVAVSLVFPFEDSLSRVTRDTFPTAQNQNDSLFLNMHRVIRPVYTYFNGQKKLCSSITFDSIGGVHPIMFDDSSLILPALTHRMRQAGYGIYDNYFFMMMYDPFLHDNITMVRTRGTVQVVSTPSLRASLGSDYPMPPNANVSKSTPIDLHSFFGAVSRHLKRRAGKG